MTLDRKSGFPVLAYPQCDNASPVSLSLVFVCNESRAQATLCLLLSLALGGVDNEQSQPFILQYDASNMVPGTGSLGPATIPLPQTRLDALARAGNPQIRTLSMKLKQPCPVWFPASAPFTPRSVEHVAFQRLAHMAQTTAIDVVFDYNWLHRQHHRLFEQLVQQPETLSGFPVGQRYRQLRYKQGDWRLLETVATIPSVSANAPDEDELPPGYAEVSGKRARRVSKSPVPVSPPRKRVLLSPFEHAHSSPTEKASTATPSPRRLEGATPSPGFPPLADTSTVRAHLVDTKHDAVPPPSRRATPIAAPSHFDHAISQTISTLLPDILSTLLPTLLPRLLTQSSTPSSQSSPASQISHAPSPPKLSALGISLTDQVLAKMERTTDLLYAHTLSHANFLRSAADDKFADMLEEERLALERTAESKYHDFEERIEGVVDGVVARVEDEAAVIEVRVAERLETLGRDVEGLKKEKMVLEMEKVALRSDVEALRADKEELRRDKMDLRRDKAELRREIDSLRGERDGMKRYQTQLEHTGTQQLVCDSSTEPES